MEEREKLKEQALKTSKLGSIVDNDDFEFELGAISTKISPKMNGLNVKQEKPQSNNNIEELLDTKRFRKAIELYKSYYDQSELLMQSSEVIQAMEFPSLQPAEVK